MPADRLHLLHLLIPFSLPSATDARAALADFIHPAFARLIARATLIETATGDAFQRTLPHERWIARQFGLVPGPACAGETSVDASSDDTPLAPYMLLADGGAPGDARWACVQPVHVQVALDHLLLIDPASLALADADAATLYAVARPLIEALGVRVQAPTPHRWYLSGDALGALAGASPLRASGRSIEIWLPHETRTGQRSRLWMKLQNEVQMAWFEHPLNEAREARGLPAVNSVWLHAQGALRPVHSPYTHVLSDAVATRGLALAARAGAAGDRAVDPVTARAADSVVAQVASAARAAHALPRPVCLPAPASFSALFSAPRAALGGVALVELDPFTSSFLEQDWPRWRAAFAVLERDWFAPALAALQAGEIRALGLTLCGDTGSVTLRITRGDLRKFWRRRTFASLCVE